MTLRQALSPRSLIHLLLLRPLLRIVFGVTLHGRDHLVSATPFVLAANHNSHLDILLLFAALPIRWVDRTHVVAAADYFTRRRWLFAVVDFLFQPIWVDRGRGGGDSLAAMQARLAAGHNIIIFPEGTRGEAGRIGDFHGGVGRLMADRPELTLIPAFLLGPERALPRSAPVPLPLWNHVFIGPPQRLAGDGRDITRDLAEAIHDLARSATAQRHRRRQSPPPACVVAVLGIDGSGKSTLTRRLAETMSVSGSAALIGDALQLYRAGHPARVQPLPTEALRAWMSRQAKQAQSLALYKIPKLTELLLRDRLLGDVQRWYGPDLVFMDGAPIFNMVAWSILYRPESFNAETCPRIIEILSHRGPPIARNDPLLVQFPELSTLHQLGLDRLALPDVVLFLDVAPAVAVERIRARGEALQVHETEEQLGRLRDAYLQVMTAARAACGIPALVLDGSQAPALVEDAARRFVEEFRGGAGDGAGGGAGDGAGGGAGDGAGAGASDGDREPTGGVADA